MSFSNLDPSLAAALQSMFADASAQGFSIQINSGFRSPEHQARIISDNWHKFDLPASDRARWEADVESMGAVQAGQRWSSIFSNARRTAGGQGERGTPMRNWIALPGSSNHQRGTAADLGYSSPEARSWAHANAGEYGLAFPLGNEPWHAELVSARMNDHSNHAHASAQPKVNQDDPSPNVSASVALTDSSADGPLAGPPATSTSPSDRSISDSVQAVANTEVLRRQEQVASQFLNAMPHQQRMTEEAMFNRALLSGETRTFNDWFAQERFRSYATAAAANDPTVTQSLTEQQRQVLAHVGRQSSQGPDKPNYMGRMFAHAFMGV